MTKDEKSEIDSLIASYVTRKEDLLRAELAAKTAKYELDVYLFKLLDKPNANP